MDYTTKVFLVKTLLLAHACCTLPQRLVLAARPIMTNVCLYLLSARMSKMSRFAHDIVIQKRHVRESSCPGVPVLTVTGTHRPDGEVFAVKVMSRDAFADADVEALAREVDILRRLDHQQVVRCDGIRIATA